MTKIDQNSLIAERQNNYRRLAEAFQMSIGENVNGAAIWREFKREIDRYSVENYEPAQRGARLTAAIKNYKTDCMMHFIFHSVLANVVDDFDITPLTFRELSKALFDGRSGAQATLVSYFGKEGRTRKATSGTHDLIDVLAEKHKEQAAKLMERIVMDIEDAKVRYRAAT